MMLWLLVSLLFAGGQCEEPVPDAPKEPRLLTTGGMITLPTMVQGEEPEEVRFWVRNNGEGDLKVESIVLEGDNIQMRVSPVLPETFQTHQFVTLRVRAKPHISPGELRGSITITSNAKPARFVVPITGKILRPNSCESNNPCIEGSFDAKKKRCTFKNVRGSCDDGNMCSVEDKCISGLCVGLPGKEGGCDEGSCTDPQLCDAFPMPAAFLDKKGNLRKNWREIHRRY
ncbi:MAG: hypothetical protein GY822_19655 [Deltaproteobacteria bacterium]|nr:hypothetical protein [Deltaproteobacteria bacterium]